MVLLVCAAGKTPNFLCLCLLSLQPHKDYATCEAAVCSPAVGSELSAKEQGVEIYPLGH